MHSILAALAATVFAFGAAPPAAAQPGVTEQRRVLGAGALTCGDWVRDAGTSSEVRLSWVLGYLTRANVYRADGDLLAHVDANGVRVWIDGYCRTHPLDTLSTATLALEKALTARQTRAK